MSQSLNKIIVAFADPSKPFNSADNQEVYESRGSGITEDKTRLWIDCNGGRLYIMLDKIVSYFIE
jgi:hypothetical protein